MSREIGTKVNPKDEPSWCLLIIFLIAVIGGALGVTMRHPACIFLGVVAAILLKISVSLTAGVIFVIGYLIIVVVTWICGRYI